jgi:hypothetical protein
MAESVIVFGYPLSYVQDRRISTDMPQDVQSEQEIVVPAKQIAAVHQYLQCPSRSTPHLKGVISSAPPLQTTSTFRDHPDFFDFTHQVRLPP